MKIEISNQSEEIVNFNSTPEQIEAMKTVYDPKSLEDTIADNLKARQARGRKEWAIKHRKMSPTSYNEKFGAFKRQSADE